MSENQPFKKGDIVRQYHHGNMFDDATVVFAHDNGALDVEIRGVRYGWSARFCEISPLNNTEWVTVMDKTPRQRHTNK